MNFHDVRQAHLITGGDFHDMDFARLELLKLLAEIPSIRATVASDYSNTTRLEDCDFLVTYTCNFAAGAEEAAALKRFLERGGRWIALHGVTAVLRFLEDGRIGVSEDHDDFMELVGTQFLAHPAIGPFRVEVVAPDHDLMRGIENFEVVDELYLFEKRAPLEVLLEARFSGSTAPFAAAEWQDERSPVLYLREVGRGAILYCSLGHCRSHYDPSPDGAFITHPLRCAWDYPIYVELLRRSIRWARAGSGEQGKPS